MADKYFTDIAKKVETGEYFEEAREWYQQKYIYPVIERSFFILLTIIAVTSSLAAVLVLMDFLPLVTSVPVVIDATDQTKYYRYIKRIAPLGSGVDPDQALMKFMASEYVQARENFDLKYFESLDQTDKTAKYAHPFVKIFSSENAYNSYKREVNIRTPNSPVLLYRDHTVRVVDIMDHTFRLVGGTRRDIKKEYQKKGISGEEANKYTATVYFVSTERNVRNEEKKSTWQAVIDLHYSDAIYNHETKKFPPLDFKVLGYQVKEVKK